MKLQSLYVVTAAPNIWQWLTSDARSVMTSLGAQVDWGDYSMPTHFTSLLVALLAVAVYLYAVIRIGLGAPFRVPLARPTTAIMFLALAYLLVGVATGFSILLGFAIVVAVYGFFDPNFSGHYKRREDRLHVF